MFTKKRLTLALFKVKIFNRALDLPLARLMCIISPVMADCILSVYGRYGRVFHGVNSTIKGQGPFRHVECVWQHITRILSL